MPSSPRARGSPRAAAATTSPALRALGNRALVGFVNLCHGSHYTDLCYGYNAFWRRLVPLLGLDADSPAPPNGGRLWGDGFEVETLIHLRVAAAGLAVTEVPSFEHSRIHGVSNLSAATRWPPGTADHPGRASPVPPDAARARVATAEPVPDLAVAPVEVAPEPTSLAAGRSGDWGPDLATRAVE